MSTEIKKILFIHHAAGWGGAPGCLIKLINQLDRSKYLPEVLLLKDSIVAEKLKENGINYSISKSKFYTNFYQFFAHSEAGYVKWFQIHNFIKQTLSWLLSRLYFAPKELSRFEFDMVHLNSSVLTDWLAPAKKRGKVIMHVREPFRNGKLDLLQYLFRHIISKNVDKIIAISKDNATRLKIPLKTEIIFDFSDIPDGMPTEESYRSKKALYLGGSSTSKGFYTLVEALDYINDNVKILFGGKYVTDTKSKVSFLGFLKYFISRDRKRYLAIQKIKKHPNAEIIGVVHNVNKFIGESCCMLSPFSVPHFSNPVIEAHLNRKPAIGSDVEGMGEIIEHEKTGLIVPRNNPKALAAAINYLSTDFEKSKMLGEAGYDIAVRKFTSSNILQIEKIYNDLLRREKKRILFIHHAAGWGGSAISLIKLISILDLSKYEPEVLLLKDSIVAQKLAESGIKFRIAESLFYKKYYHFFAHSEAGYIKWYQIHSFIKMSISWILSRYFFAKRELTRFDYDIVHLNSSVLTDWLALAKRRGKVIMHIREPFRKGKLDIFHFFFRSIIKKNADKIIAISKDNARRINLPTKTSLIYNYSDLPNENPALESYFSKSVLYMGGSSTSKGFFTVVKALDYLNHGIKIYFAGEYVVQEKTKNLKFFLSNARKRNIAIKKINEHPNAVFLGNVYDVSQYLNKVCCHLSPFMVPHFSRPVIEAHLFRKPSIGSDVEGMDEIIEHGNNGLIVPRDNPQALAQAINLITSDGNMARSYGLAGYITAVRNFSPENMKKIESIYAEILA